LKKTHHKKAGGVAQGVGTEFISQCCKKKKKKERKIVIRDKRYFIMVNVSSNSSKN
jgi:hypothetical protein